LRKAIFHLSGERGWRGGEIQLRLLLAHLDRNPDDRLFVPAGSELARRVAFEPMQRMGRLGFRDLATALAVRRAIKKAAGPVILHAHSSKAVETALLARVGLNVPLVISRHTAFTVKSAWKYRAADALVAVSQATRDQLLKAGIDSGRIAVIPIAVDDTKLEATLVAGRPARPSGGPVVLHAAAFTAEKDHATLLRAWSVVEREVKNARLVLAGDGPLKPQCAALAGELGLRRVEFAGWVEDVERLIRECDLAVLSSRLEGMPVFLCEAQWCGRPVVATRAGGTADAVEDGVTGLLGEPGDAEALADNLLQLIADPDRRAEMGDRAAVRARRLFAPAAMAEAYERLYRSL
jgi:glycosyltransferase involved in cell wall biosynthesis